MTLAADTGRPAPRALRVASYNVRDLKDDVAAVGRVVRAIGPDVLCLQEAPRHPFAGHRVADLAARCGLYWTGGHRGSGGTTILTSLRVTVADHSHTRLPVPFRQRPRGYAVARVALPAHPWLTVVSAHLPLDAAARESHAGLVLRRMAQAGPAVLAGDFNEEADGAAYQAVAAVLRPVSPEAPTFTARTPRRRLDVIFASADLVAVPAAAVELDPADLAAATDHRPVWVDLRHR